METHDTRRLQSRLFLHWEAMWLNQLLKCAFFHKQHNVYASKCHFTSSLELFPFMLAKPQHGDKVPISKPQEINIWFIFIKVGSSLFYAINIAGLVLGVGSNILEHQGPLRQVGERPCLCTLILDDRLRSSTQSSNPLKCSMTLKQLKMKDRVIPSLSQIPTCIWWQLYWFPILMSDS